MNILKIAKDGSILEPNLHDGYVNGIVIGADKIVELYLSDVNGARYVMFLEKLAKLNVTDFWEGNIILSAAAFKSQDCSKELIKELIGELYDLELEGAHKKELSESGLLDDRKRELDALVNEAYKDNLTLLEIRPSYGCTLLALCGEVKLGEA